MQIKFIDGLVNDLLFQIGTTLELNMTDKIVPFKKPEEEKPTLSGTAKCLVCRYEWIAVAPIGTHWLECPICKHETSRFIAPVAREGMHWQCLCGNDLFYIMPERTYCSVCGKNHYDFGK